MHVHNQRVNQAKNLVTDKIPIIITIKKQALLTSNGAPKLYVAVNRKLKIALSLTME
jgi:hypothetical protein